MCCKGHAPGGHALIELAARDAIMGAFSCPLSQSCAMRMHGSARSNACTATGLFHTEAGGGSSAAAVKGRVLAQAEAASEEMGVEGAVKRALRGVADLVRLGEGLLHILSKKESKHEACIEFMAVRQALCRVVDSPQCSCARMPLRCNARADFAGACLQGRRVWALPGNRSVSGAASSPLTRLMMRCCGRAGAAVGPDAAPCRRCGAAFWR